jgi:hypothetical protein
MSMARLVITAVVIEGRSKSEVARDYEISRVRAQKLMRRVQTEHRGNRSAPTGSTNAGRPTSRCEGIASIWSGLSIA